MRASTSSGCSTPTSTTKWYNEAYPHQRAVNRSLRPATSSAAAAARVSGAAQPPNASSGEGSRTSLSQRLYSLMSALGGGSTNILPSKENIADAAEHFFGVKRFSTDRSVNAKTSVIRHQQGTNNTLRGKDPSPDSHLTPFGEANAIEDAKRLLPLLMNGSVSVPDIALLSPLHRPEETAWPTIEVIEHVTGKKLPVMIMEALREQGGCVGSTIEMEGGKTNLKWMRGIEASMGDTFNGSIEWDLALGARGEGVKDALTTLASEICARTGKDSNIWCFSHANIGSHIGNAVTGKPVGFFNGQHVEWDTTIADGKMTYVGEGFSDYPLSSRNPSERTDGHLSITDWLKTQPTFATQTAREVQERLAKSQSAQPSSLDTVMTTCAEDTRLPKTFSGSQKANKQYMDMPWSGASALSTSRAQTVLAY